MHEIIDWAAAARVLWGTDRTRSKVRFGSKSDGGRLQAHACRKEGLDLHKPLMLLLRAAWCRHLGRHAP